MPETNPINSIAALSWAKHAKAPSYLFKLDNEKTIYVDGVKQELSEQNNSFRKKVDLIIDASEQLPTTPRNYFPGPAGDIWAFR